LVRSATDRAVFDLIPDVAARYLVPHDRSNLEIWNFYRQILERRSRVAVVFVMTRAKGHAAHDVQYTPDRHRYGHAKPVHAAHATDALGRALGDYQMPTSAAGHANAFTKI
jgi:hypothetical protein